MYKGAAIEAIYDDLNCAMYYVKCHAIIRSSRCGRAEA
jgi:hypothetical protein